MNADDVFIHKTAEVHPTARLGKGTKVWNGVQVRERAVLGQDCNLGKDTYVDLDVTLGDRVRVQNGVSIFKGVRIGNDVFVGPHACFTNDLYPRAFNRDFTLVATGVEDGASIGAGAIILCGVTIGAYALVGIGAVVTRDVPAHGLVFGNPATLRGYVCRCGRPLPGGTATVENPPACAHCGSTWNGPSR